MIGSSAAAFWHMSQGSGPRVTTKKQSHHSLIIGCSHPKVIQNPDWSCQDLVKDSELIATASSTCCKLLSIELPS